MARASCSKCPATWTGSRMEHCPACHRTFSGTTAGDKHRRGPGDHQVCVDPAEVGLVLDEARNLWRLPGGRDFGGSGAGAA